MGFLLGLLTSASAFFANSACARAAARYVAVAFIFWICGMSTCHHWQTRAHIFPCLAPKVTPQPVYFVPTPETPAPPLAK